MKAAEDGRMYDAAHVLDGAMDRSVLLERSMGTTIKSQSSSSLELRSFIMATADPAQGLLDREVRK